MKAIDNLKKALDEPNRILKEIARVKAAAAAADKEIAEAVRTGHFESEADRKKLSNAGLTKQLAPPTLEKLDGELRQAEEALVSAYKRGRNDWDDWVLQKKSAKFEELIALVLPFFGGEEKAKLTREEFSRMHVPVIAEIQRCFSADFFTEHPTVKDYMEWSRLHLAKVERVIAAMGWKLPE
jgi:hypothetical protein